MSDARAKAERSEAKDSRQIPAQDGVCQGSKKKKALNKPWHVKAPRPFRRERIMTWHKAKTKDMAQAWIEKWARSGMDASKMQIEYHGERA